MGRREQKERERERKRAPAICKRLELLLVYLPPKKKIAVGNDGAAGSESVGESDWKAVDSSSERLSPESAAALLPSHS